MPLDIGNDQWLMDTKLLSPNGLEIWESSYFGKVSAERVAGYSWCLRNLLLSSSPEAVPPAWVQKCMVTSTGVAGLLRCTQDDNLWFL